MIVYYENMNGEKLNLLKAPFVQRRLTGSMRTGQSLRTDMKKQ